MCLGGDLRRGVNQKPFEGKLEYTHLMWIDSDIIFSVDNFKALLKQDKDVIPEGTDFSFNVDHEKEFSQEEFDAVVEEAFVYALEKRYKECGFSFVSSVDSDYIYDSASGKPTERGGFRRAPLAVG
jgi:hypothetical protein